jgi:hypothetical protein
MVRDIAISLQYSPKNAVDAARFSRATFVILLLFPAITPVAATLCKTGVCAAGPGRARQRLMTIVNQFCDPNRRAGRYCRRSSWGADDPQTKES